MGSYEHVKYSGALRYFKPEIVSLLTSYETSTNYLLKIAQAYLNFRNDCLVPFCTQQTNPRFLFAITNNKPIPNPVFSQTPTQEKLDQIYRYALFVNSQMKHQINIVQDQQKKAAALIKVLKEN